MPPIKTFQYSKKAFLRALIDKVVVQAFDWDYLTDCHNRSPELLLAALGEGELTDAKLDELQTTGATIVGWNYKSIGTPEIEAIHSRGLKAWVYTVNDPSRARLLHDAGIDGIITDVPSQLLLN